MDTGNTNPADGDAHTNDRLWVVFAIMLFSWIITWFWTSLSRLNWILRVVPFIALGVATFTYYWMASDQGWMIVPSEPVSHATCLVWYVRDIQQMINMPLVLLVLLSLTSLDTAQVLSVLIFSWAWVASGSVAAYTPPLIKVSRVACAQLSMVNVGTCILDVLRDAKFAHSDFETAFSVGAMYLSLTSAFYPICTNLSESCDTASATACYAILDILSTPIFLIGFLFYVSWFSDQQIGAIARGLNAEEGTKVRGKKHPVTDEGEQGQTRPDLQGEVAPGSDRGDHLG